MKLTKTTLIKVLHVSILGGMELCLGGLSLPKPPRGDGTAVQSMRRSMNWTLDDNMGDGLFFCATLTGRRRCHTPFEQAGAEMSDTSAEAVKPGPRCSWEGHFRWVGASVGDESAESCRVVGPPRIPLVVHPVRHTYSMLLSDSLMSCCAVGANGCLDLRRRTFALSGPVSAEWNRCLGSMARRARDSMTPLRRSSPGWIPVKMGRLSTGVGSRHPVTIRKASLMAWSIRWA